LLPNGLEDDRNSALQRLVVRFVDSDDSYRIDAGIGSGC
jgi:hypothetical protein